MRDPFQSENSKAQMVREAQIGLSVIAILLTLFAYVAYYRIVGMGQQIPAQVRQAPVAESVWPYEESGPIRSNFADAAENQAPTKGIDHGHSVIAQSSFNEPIAEARKPVQKFTNQYDNRNSATNANRLDRRNVDQAGSYEASFHPIPSPGTTLKDLQRQSIAAPANPIGSPHVEVKNSTSDGSFSPFGQSKNRSKNTITTNVADDPFVSKPTEKFVQRNAPSLPKPLPEKEPKSTSTQSPLDFQPIGRPNANPNVNAAISKIEPSLTRSKRLPSLPKVAKPEIASVEPFASKLPAPPDTNQFDTIPLRNPNQFAPKPIRESFASDSLKSKGSEEPFKFAPKQPERVDARSQSSIEQQPVRMNALRGGAEEIGLRQLTQTKPGSNTQPELKPATDRQNPQLENQIQKNRWRDRATEFTNDAAGAPLVAKSNSLTHSIIPDTNTFNSTEQSFVANDSAKPGSSMLINVIGTNQGETAAGEADADLANEPSTFHVVQTGDSLWTIAQSRYGDGRYFRALFEFNEGSLNGVDVIPVGTRISTPDKTELQRRWPTLCPRNEELTGAPDGLLQHTVERSYVTREGDTLFDIAGERLGQASRYLELIHLNSMHLPVGVNHLTPLPAKIELSLPH